MHLDLLDVVGWARRPVEAISGLAGLFLYILAGWGVAQTSHCDMTFDPQINYAVCAGVLAAECNCAGSPEAQGGS